MLRKTQMCDYITHLFKSDTRVEIVSINTKERRPGVIRVDTSEYIFSDILGRGAFGLALLYCLRAKGHNSKLQKIVVRSFKRNILSNQEDLLVRVLRKSFPEARGRGLIPLQTVTYKQICLVSCHTRRLFPKKTEWTRKRF